MRRIALSTLVVLLAALSAGAAGAARTDAAAGITVVGHEPARGGSTVWRGGAARLAEARFLRGARLPVVSPDGRSVAFARRTRDGLDVFLTGSVAGWEQRLAHVAGAMATSLAFSPDGRTVAFASPRGTGLVSVVPGTRVRLLALPARWRGATLAALAFSPDGRLLAFSRTSGDGRAGTLRNELAAIGVDGRGARTLVRNPDPFSAQYRPAFSPDGSRIAYAAADGSLAVVPTTGRAPARLTPARAAGSARTDSGPVWSPDGTTIAFTRARGAGGSDVFLVRANGTGLRRLTTTPLPPPGEPRTGSRALAWSPDGARVLAFRHDRFAAVEAASGASTPLGTAGVQYGLGSAVWR